LILFVPDLVIHGAEGPERKFTQQLPHKGYYSDPPIISLTIPEAGSHGRKSNTNNTQSRFVNRLGARANEDRIEIHGPTLKWKLTFHLRSQNPNSQNSATADAESQSATESPR